MCHANACSVTNRPRPRSTCGQIGFSNPSRLRGPIRHSIGKSRPALLATPELKSMCVCRECNNGWMSCLESTSKPLIGSLMHDVSLWLQTAQQSAVAAWSMKTAMVVESVARHGRTPCYSRQQRERLRADSLIPMRTNIWLARFSGSSIGAFGSDIWLDLEGVPKAANGCAITLIIGHLAIQILSAHVRPEYNDSAIEVRPMDGPWDRLLARIWPVGSTVIWPPAMTFTNHGTLCIAKLLNRWKIGNAA